jgi:hypothetical protein
MTHSWTVGSGSPETDEANGGRQLTTGTIKDFVWAGCRNRTLDQITGATTATPTAQ